MQTIGDVTPSKEVAELLADLQGKADPCDGNWYRAAIWAVERAAISMSVDAA